MYGEKQKEAGSSHIDATKLYANESIQTVTSRLEKVLSTLFLTSNGLDYILEKLVGPIPSIETKGNTDSGVTIHSLLTTLENVVNEISNKQENVFKLV